MPKKKKERIFQDVLYFQNKKEDKLDYILFNNNFNSIYDDSFFYALSEIKKHIEDFKREHLGDFFSDCVVVYSGENADDLAREKLIESSCKVCKKNFIFKSEPSCKCLDEYGYCPNCRVRYEPVSYSEYPKINYI